MTAETAAVMQYIMDGVDLLVKGQLTIAALLILNMAAVFLARRR